LDEDSTDNSTSDDSSHTLQAVLDFQHLEEEALRDLLKVNALQCPYCETPTSPCLHIAGPKGASLTSGVKRLHLCCQTHGYSFPAQPLLAAHKANPHVAQWSNAITEALRALPSLSTQQKQELRDLLSTYDSSKSTSTNSLITLVPVPTLDSLELPAARTLILSLQAKVQQLEAQNQGLKAQLSALHSRKPQKLRQDATPLSPKPSNPSPKPSNPSSPPTGAQRKPPPSATYSAVAQQGDWIKISRKKKPTAAQKATAARISGPAPVAQIWHRILVQLNLRREIRDKSPKELRAYLRKFWLQIFGISIRDVPILSTIGKSLAELYVCEDRILSVKERLCRHSAVIVTSSTNMLLFSGTPQATPAQQRNSAINRIAHLLKMAHTSALKDCILQPYQDDLAFCEQAIQISSTLPLRVPVQSAPQISAAPNRHHE
jgi:hypothetical protein